MKSSDINFTILSTFIAVHGVTIWALWEAGFEYSYLGWALGIYTVRWLGFTCAAHRFFAHRVCRTSRTVQFLMGVWATLTMARCPIKFASGHRHHHLYSDTNRDLHSPSRNGLLSAYIGWVISNDYDEERLGRVGDLKRYPELVILNRFYYVPNALLLAVLYSAGGMPALAYGGLLSTSIVWHVAFSVTVAFHRIGTPRYETYDESRNSLILGLLLFGEGWHNNHHANMSSCRMGERSYEIDVGYLVFLVLEKLGIVWDVNKTIGSRIYRRLEGNPTQISPQGPVFDATKAADRYAA
ncbi:MAG: acyl-CoA desaturase [Nitrospiraceae bacterium]